MKKEFFEEYRNCNEEIDRMYAQTKQLHAEKCKGICLVDDTVFYGGDHIKSPIASIECKSRCGPGTKLVDNTCVIDFGDPFCT